MVASQAFEERERKFLLKSSGWRKHVRNSIEITQVFLNAPKADQEVRLRIEHQADGTGQGMWIIKNYQPNGTAQTTLSVMDVGAAQDLLQSYKLEGAIKGNLIRKTRYFLDVPGDGFWCVDDFHAPLKNFQLAEHEFKDGARGKLIKPAWLGKEVTKDADYRNEALARKGLPRNQREL